MAAPHENQRREARYDVRMPVMLYRGKVAQSLEATDVSFKGLFVCTSDPPSLRSLVRLRVTLVGHAFDAHAMAVHVVRAGDENARPEGVGLQFWGLSGRDRAAWDDFVRTLMSAQRPPRPASKIASPLIQETPVTPMTPSGVRVVAGAAPVVGASDVAQRRR